MCAGPAAQLPLECHTAELLKLVPLILMAIASNSFLNSLSVHSGCRNQLVTTW